ncbi:MAG: deoxyribonuclease IV [Bacilli bacterium]
MLLIGSHVSFKSSNQLVGSVKEALSYGSNTFMFYTGAPQNTNRCPISYELTLEARNLLYDNNIDLNSLVIHASYVINLANKEKQSFSVEFLKEEIKRASMLGVPNLVIHPGNFVSYGLEAGIQNIIDGLNATITKNQDVFICLETMSGKGSEVCYNFDQIKQIIDGVKYSDKVKICIDTCHLNDAGYDISDFDKILDEIDEKLGIDRIACVHVNDSKNPLNSHKDRHENVGFGYVGFHNLINVMYNKRLDGIPKILETPYVSINENGKDRSYPPYKFEIDMIKNKRFNENLLDDVRNYYKK